MLRSPRGQMTLALAALAAVAIAAPAPAATVYRWTDANGTVHFGDAPPPHPARVETEDLPDVPAPATQAPAAEASPAAGKTPAGPARVALTDRKAEAVGPAAQLFRGTVKNEGGDEARDVAVNITVTEPVQGAECLHDRIDVEPSTLAPGAEGSFEARFENPCFHGPTDTDLRVEWR
jgi:Domain of unknown function (DUF4124)